MKNSKGELVCDFCDKNSKETKIIVAWIGPSERYAAICGDCVSECVQAIVESYKPKDE